MRILIVGLNYAPEQVGIARYTTGLAEALAARGHAIRVVAAQPYYPQWRTYDGHRGVRFITTQENGVVVTRCPIYVPAQPSGGKRIIHHASFAAAVTGPALAAARRLRPKIVLTIAPSLIGAPVARLAARVAGARSWLHVQDFEIEAAFATGLMRNSSVGARAALAFQRRVITGFDRVSSISAPMCAKLAAISVPPDRIVEFRNWADIGGIRPLDGPSPYRAELGLGEAKVALYSGNIANKQGIGVVVDAARRLARRPDIAFLICGEGPQKAELVRGAADLPQVRFVPLQPAERLSDLLGLATVHLLPQLAGAADLLLPSKLTNMLASGRPVVATADAGTGLAVEVEGCGIVTAPGDAAALAGAIESLVDNPTRAAALGREARTRAEQRWSDATIIGRFEAELSRLAGERDRA